MKPISYKPSSYYWRKDIAAAASEGDVECLAAIAEALADELAEHKKVIRDLGYWPPKNRFPASEAAVKPSLSRGRS